MIDQRNLEQLRYFAKELANKRNRSIKGELQDDYRVYQKELNEFWCKRKEVVKELIKIHKLYSGDKSEAQKELFNLIIELGGYDNEF